MDSELNSLDIQKASFRKEDRQSRSEDLNEKARGVFKISSSDPFTEEFFRQYKKTRKSKMRIGKEFKNNNSDTFAQMKRVDETDEELLDFVRGKVQFVGISNGEGTLIQNILFNQGAFREREMIEWLENRGLKKNYKESKELSNHWENQLISKSSFSPSEWRMYSFKNEMKVVAGYFENY